MKQFINGSGDAFADLRQRLTRSTVVFSDCTLPSGCQPQRGRVGFEARPSGRYALLVDPGTAYAGTAELRPLFESGEIVFDSFDALIRFVQGPLSDAFDGRASSQAQAPETLTDLDAVADAVSERQKAIADIRVEDIQQSIQSTIFGQDSAVQTIAELAVRHASRRQPTRPTTLFLLGPTGVGKTSACQALAQSLKDSGYQFLRLDMAEYQEAYRVSQLLGSPQGYAGHGDSSQFIRHLARYPKSVLLFDEIEKAHRDVFRMFMNLMDAGRISSAASVDGRHEIDARESILAFTSNLGADRLLGDIDQLERNAGEDLIDELCRRHLVEQHIPRELVGRIQAFALFRPLESRHRAAAMVAAIERTGRTYGVSVKEVTPESVAELIARADQRFGVRQDEYLIERSLGKAFINAYRDGLQDVRVVHSPLRVDAVGCALTPHLCAT
ncbi:AAA family ATPase [Candidatus Symbiobacter mobilis]|uniref:ATPase-like protein n=1 Tax=Candidatus Symbiobacter mobilis CR TaxID=946483 RepID=U5NEZ1_9BURK|nr:AAA family ATPase [Candidatus Symbiobacter mobilis]AGX88734.1 ATPase-like protein [Candidatus Symbiobacter mobilis CR]